MATQLNTCDGAVDHVRFACRGFDIPLSIMDMGRSRDDGQMKRTLVHRPAMPQAIFG